MRGWSLWVAGGAGAGLWAARRRRGRFTLRQAYRWRARWWMHGGRRDLVARVAAWPGIETDGSRAVCWGRSFPFFFCSRGIPSAVLSAGCVCVLLLVGSGTLFFSYPHSPFPLPRPTIHSTTSTLRPTRPSSTPRSRQRASPTWSPTTRRCGCCWAMWAPRAARGGGWWRTRRCGRPSVTMAGDVRFLGWRGGGGQPMGGGPCYVMGGMGEGRRGRREVHVARLVKGG